MRRVIEHNREQYTLTDCVEIYALMISSAVFDEDEKEGIEKIMRNCKILNSLTDALKAVNGN